MTTKVKDAAQDERKTADGTVVEQDRPNGPQLPATVDPADSAKAAAESAKVAAEPPAAGLPVTPFANLAAAVALTTAEIAEHPVVKQGKNQHFNYTYARMQDILASLAPIMSKHGLVIMQREVSKAWMDNGQAIAITYEFTVLHKSGEVWPEKQQQTGLSNCRTSTGKFDDKAINKCHTAARKYFLLSLFQIPTEDESDADRGDNDAGARRPAQKPEAKPPERKPASKQQPHTISNDGLKLAEWAGLYIEQINLCETLDEIRDYKNLNENSLNVVAEKSPKIYTKIEDAETARTNDIAAKAAQP